MNTPLQKRFWKDVSIRPEASGFGVFLDDRQLKTPLKSSLLAPTKAVAEGIAAEWAAVEDKIDPSKMHLTRCANATIDKVVQEHAAVAAMLSEYGSTDLLCYRAGSPEELVARQAAAWDPMLAWIAQAHGVELLQIIGVMHQKQPPEGQAKLQAMTLAFDPWRMTALHDLVTISGSLILGLAVATRYMS
ncbi:MAG: ATP12 family chaperone protein, partial [Alphaproteobacteria bacterium]